ncbi:hypothetical protein FRC16_007916 [Serendipita sp. 398]|nr:hypothetical protein FRC16_007916 [Serendipita sp. 398]
MSLTVRRELLNSKFDGYKLAPIPENNAVKMTPLPRSGLSQATVSASSHLYFQEVQSRVRHNHLAVGLISSPQSPSATLGYVDKEGAFTLVLIDRVSYIFTHTGHSKASNNVHSPQTASRGSEYPVSISVAPLTWVISDGSGQFYVLQIEPQLDKARLLGQHEFMVDNSVTPCRLHSAQILGESIVLLVSSRAEVRRTSNRKPSVRFDISALRIPLSFDSDSTTEFNPVEILWRKRGTDIPSYASALAGNWLVCASCTFEDPSVHQDTGREPMTSSTEDSQPTGKPPPPYSWTQTGDSLTMAIPLPSSTPKSHIHVNIAAKHLSVLVTQVVEDSNIPLPRYAMKELWDYVDRESSLWTWDQQGDLKFGLLTLHLEKKHDGTKWPSIFAQRPSPANEDDVPETVDPSEMWKIREALEKYTSELHADPGADIPSLASGEMDPSVDSEVGRRLTMSYLDILTGDAVSRNTSFEEVLALPLQHELQDESGINPRSLVIKRGIDGLLFNGPIVPSVDLWEHVSTFPALAFVLASKRDTRFVYHTGKAAALALENGGTDFGPNMYSYHDAQGATRAKQGVSRLGSDGRAGSLLGVCGIQGRQGLVLVCLRERELVLVEPFV